MKNEVMASREVHSAAGLATHITDMRRNWGLDHYTAVCLVLPSGELHPVGTLQLVRDQDNPSKSMFVICS